VTSTGPSHHWACVYVVAGFLHPVPFPVDVAAFKALPAAALVPLLQAYGLAPGGPVANRRAALEVFMSRLW
jgi:hypothetical protein